jgi:deoxyxylulose-5-phosphate synthase
MQAASDPFLGWSEGPTSHYYWRQLRDMKGSAAVETHSPRVMASYARLCGWTLARAHARSGDPVAIASYMGTGSVFDKAIATFAERYADQNQADHGRLVAAIESGRVEAAEEN